MPLLTQDELLFQKFGVEPGELLWSGRPPAGLRFNRSDFFMIPFSLIWLGFVSVFMGAALVHGGAMLLFGIPFLCVGLYVVAGRFVWDAYRRRGTRYGVTADSAVIVRDGIGGGAQRIYLPSTPRIAIEPQGNGAGTIIFGQPPVIGSQSAVWSGGLGVPAFEGIPDVSRVYDLCITAQRGANCQVG